MKIVHLSDLHLTADGGELFGSSPLARLHLAIDSILAAHADTDFCLLTCDLADAGDAAYASPATALRRLPMPWHLLPGNHDARAAMRGGFPQLVADAGGFLQNAIATPAGRFMLLDAEALWSLIAPYRSRIRHLFFGHIHRPVGGNWRGIPFSCTSSPNHQVALDLSTRRCDDVPGCREPAGYALILITGESVVVHHQQLVGGETTFWL